MNARILMLGAVALLGANVANADVVYNTVTGTTTSSGAPDGPQADGVTMLGNSFTSASASSLTVSLLLTNTAAATGSAMVYLVQDSGTGGANGLAGYPTSNNAAGTFTGFTAANSDLLGTVSASSVTSSPQLVSFKAVTPTFTTSDDEYWVVMVIASGSSLGWEYEGSDGGTGTGGQEIFNNFGEGGAFIGMTPASDAVAGSFPYQMIVSAPEPATFALLGSGLVGLGWSRRRRAKRA
jgi:hypothetical protein